MGQLAEDRGKSVTIRDVAKLAGVGIGTVSRYVSGNGSVKEATRLRIQDAITQLNYLPNVHAMGLRGVIPKTVGIMVPDISNPLFSSIIKRLEERLRKERYSVILTSPSGEASHEVDIASTLISRRIEGLFIIPCGEDNEALHSLFQNAGFPIIVIDRYFLLGHPGVAHIQTNHSTGMRAVAQHLLETGHRNFLLLHADSTKPGLERSRSFRDAIESMGGASVRLVAGSQYTSFAYDTVLDSFVGGKGPDAIVVAHNQMLPGVLMAMRILGRRVGKDVSIVTSDKTDLSEFHTPPIATITRDLEQMGDLAFELFAELRMDPSAAPMRQVETTFHARDSIRHDAAD